MGIPSKFLLVPSKAESFEPLQNLKKVPTKSACLSILLLKAIFTKSLKPVLLKDNYCLQHNNPTPMEKTASLSQMSKRKRHQQRRRDLMNLGRGARGWHFVAH
jgi:hypothetical protein